METLIAEGIGKTYKGRQVVRGVDLRSRFLLRVASAKASGAKFFPEGR